LVSTAATLPPRFTYALIPAVSNAAFPRFEGASSVNWYVIAPPALSSKTQWRINDASFAGKVVGGISGTSAA
jgi:hypothetical protein